MLLSNFLHQCHVHINGMRNNRFSGDTMPAPHFASAVRSPTLLIHEATMADEEEELAKQKYHSTMGQALEIGRRCVKGPLVFSNSSLILQ